MHPISRINGKPTQFTPALDGTEDATNCEKQLAELMNNLLKALAADGDTHKADRDTFLHMMRAAVNEGTPCDAAGSGAKPYPWAMPTPDLFDLATFARRVLAQYARYTHDR